MPYKATSSIFSLQVPPAGIIIEVAGRNSLYIDTVREQRLQSMGETLHGATLEAEEKQGDERFYYEFSHRDLDISLVCQYPGSPRYPDANVDFYPSGEADRNISYATPIILDAITALQDYCLLVEAGFIKQPRVLRGYTNPTMARIAQRIGFVITAEDNAEGATGLTTTEAPYEDLKAAIFSEKIRYTAKRLQQRLERLQPVE